MAVQDQPWTVLRLINWTREYFAAGGLGEPRLAAEVLLAHVLGWERIDLYTRFEHEPAPDELASFRELVARARRHEPVAYLVGWREFYSMRFKVTADVLVPRPETEVLVSEAVAHLRSLRRPGRMWDACTGSGCVAIAAARHVPDVSVLATDVSPAAVELAAGNAAAHGLAGRVRCRVADLLEVPDDCEDWRRVDFLSANAPYVAAGEAVDETVRHEPAVAVFAGGDGLEKIRPLIGSAGELLVAGGKLAMEFGEGQADAVRGLLAATGAFEEPRIVRDHQGMDRTVVASRRG